MADTLIGNFPLVAAIVLMGIGLYILIFRRNLIKIVMGIAILSSRGTGRADGTSRGAGFGLDQHCYCCGDLGSNTFPGHTHLSSYWKPGFKKI